MIVPGMFVCSRFLIRVSMYIVSSATGGAIWLNLFLRCYGVAWACLVCLLLCKEEGSSPVSLQLLKGGIWTCMKCPRLGLCWVLEWGLS